MSQGVEGKTNWKYRLSFLCATWIGCKLGIRQPYSKISKDDAKFTMWLGAVLLHHESNKNNFFQRFFHRHLLTTFVKLITPEDKPLLIIQVLEDSEITTPIAGDLKALDKEVEW